MLARAEVAAVLMLHSATPFFVLGSSSAEIKLLPTFFQSSLLELQTLAHSLRGIIRELAGVEDLTIPVA